MRHDKLGLASLLCGIAAIACDAGTFYLLWSALNGGVLMPEQNVLLDLLGWGSRIFLLLGFFAGIAGLMQAHRRKAFAVTGTAICSVLIFLEVAMNLAAFSNA